jgi:FAD/FMN-containing dehydrogenase
LLPAGLRHYCKGTFARDLADGAIAAHVEYGGRIPCAETATLVFPIDGACHRVAPDATAFAYRDARFATGLGPSWRSAADDAANIEGSPVLRGAPALLRGGRQNYDRLTEVKRRYDPANVFRLNQNIVP